MRMMPEGEKKEERMMMMMMMTTTMTIKSETVTSATTILQLDSRSTAMTFLLFTEERKR